MCEKSELRSHTLGSPVGTTEESQTLVKLATQFILTEPPRYKQYEVGADLRELVAGTEQRSELGLADIVMCDNSFSCREYWPYLT